MTRITNAIDSLRTTVSSTTQALTSTRAQKIIFLVAGVGLVSVAATTTSTLGECLNLRDMVINTNCLWKFCKYSPLKRSACYLRVFDASALAEKAYASCRNLFETNLTFIPNACLSLRDTLLDKNCHANVARAFFSKDSIESTQDKLIAAHEAYKATCSFLGFPNLIYLTRYLYT